MNANAYTTESAGVELAPSEKAPSVALPGTPVARNAAGPGMSDAKPRDLPSHQSEPPPQPQTTSSFSSAFSRIYRGWIHKQIHSQHFIADLAYKVLPLLEHWYARFRCWTATREAISPRELRGLRMPFLTDELIIGLTNFCNAACVFCAKRKVTLNTGFMSEERFEKTVDEFVSLSGRAIDFTQTIGEPLLDSKICDRIAYARRAGVRYVGFTTNGILLNKDKNYQRIIDAGVTRVDISLGGTDRASYKEAYGVDKFDAAFSGVRNLLEYNRQMGQPCEIRIRFRSPVSPGSIARSAPFREFVRPYLSHRVSVYYTQSYDNWGGTVKLADLVGVMRFAKPLPQTNVPCQRLFSPGITQKGDVRLCSCRLKDSDDDDMVVGNLKDSSLESLMNGTRAWSIINGFFSGRRPETCRNCTLYQPITRSWVKARLAAKPVDRFTIGILKR